MRTQMFISTAAVTLLCLSCGQNTMVEFPLVCPATGAPVVFVGRVVVPPTSVGDIHKSRFDGSPLMLYRFQVAVENVFRGETTPGVETIYYYAHLNRPGSALTVGSMVTNERAVFFLVRDSGNLRLVFDDSRRSMPIVRTGAHLDFKPKPYERLDDAIIELMLSRGNETTDQQLIQAMHTNFDFVGADLASDNEPYIRRLRALAKTETPEVTSEACKILKSLERSCEEPKSPDSVGRLSP